MRRMVSEVLRKAGFSVIEGANGEEALRRAEGAAVRLVITDFNMPVMGGMALIERLRARPEYRHTPILVLTTEAGAGRKQEGRAAGATGWVVKPFNPGQLLELVNRLVPNPPAPTQREDR
jgi:two-component system chemotaxis response regulator CheY